MTTTTDLARVQPMTDDEMRLLWRISEALAQSGRYPDARRPAEAFAKVALGRDLGLSASASMIGLHIVEGRPFVGYTMLAAFVRQSEDYDYEGPHFSGDGQSATVRLLRVLPDGRKRKLGDSTFSIADAKAAELGGSRNGGPFKAGSGWAKNPRNMLAARALSNGVRFFAPDATLGLPVYVDGADEAERTGDLTAGEGNGHARGIGLGEKVDAVLQRAAELGHAGLSDRATVEMALGSQSPEHVAQWVKDATAELDALEGMVEAEVVEPESPQERAAQLRTEANGLLDEAQSEPDDGAAQILEARAQDLRAAADALAPEPDADQLPL